MKSDVISIFREDKTDTSHPAAGGWRCGEVASRAHRIDLVIRHTAMTND